jgi:hypothetical protein
VVANDQTAERFASEAERVEGAENRDPGRRQEPLDGSPGFLSRARPHARTGHITPMGPIFSPSANFFCSSLNEA